MAETCHNILLLHSIVNSVYMFVLTFENAITFVAIYHSNITSPAVHVHSTVYASPIHSFNKSGRHLEFSMNDVIRGKIIRVAKMALLTLILQCVHIKKHVFTLYREEYFLSTMSLWVCYRNFKTFVQNIPGSMTSMTNES